MTSLGVAVEGFGLGVGFPGAGPEPVETGDWLGGGVGVEEEVGLGVGLGEGLGVGVLGEVVMPKSGLQKLSSGDLVSWTSKTQPSSETVFPPSLVAPRH